MTTPTPANPDGAFNYSSKIQSLLATAASYTEAGNLEAAETYQTKAEQLMRAYRIAEETALATDPGSSAPISTKIRITTWGGYGGSPDSWYTEVFHIISKHTGVRYSNDRDHGTVATVVGYEGDVRYTEFLWTAALMMFATRIDPRWDDTLPEAENVWRLRNAGIERRVIADRAWGAYSGKIAANRSKVQRIYLKECQRRGEPARAEGLGFKTEVYREAYAESFRKTLEDRLRVARDAADSVGGVMVMHGRADRVDEAFYELFPGRRPKPPVPMVYVAPEPCPKCTPEKECRAHRWTAADEARYQARLRRAGSASARAGGEAGQTAAEGVLIARGHDVSNRVPRGGTRALNG
jgi:hypothetical protein